MITLKEAFTKQYPKYSSSILGMYESATGKEATWENLTKLGLSEFVEYMSERLAPNSVKQYATKLKAVLNRYSEEVDLPRGFEKVLSPKKEKPSNTWLTEADLKKLLAYEPNDLNERLVKEQFLIGAYTGARHSDYIRFDETNIVEGMLCYVSQKTRIQATVPLKPVVSELLKSMPEGELSDVGFNKILRRICKKAGIKEQVKVYKAGEESIGEKWQFVSSHTARRSFATNLYLLGADLYSISRMMGHSSVTMTETYISCGLKDLPERVMRYFK